ncbi:hypothetical protein Q5P01_015615 [Channa striata]|uniref:Uncharacterized protein n=1 Tax=Channa striata TaxID=64152 RepID=A0AA88MES9_CHASR|nr:hypothetical protein Q5P01_015615 [Channa striata]
MFALAVNFWRYVRAKPQRLQNTQEAHNKEIMANTSLDVISEKAQPVPGGQQLLHAPHAHEHLITLPSSPCYSLKMAARRTVHETAPEFLVTSPTEVHSLSFQTWLFLTSSFVEAILLLAAFEALELDLILCPDLCITAKSDC